MLLDERLEWLIRWGKWISHLNLSKFNFWGHVDRLVFLDFTFTDLFVEKFEEFFGPRFDVPALHIHNCNFMHVSTSSFHQLVGTLIKAKGERLHTYIHVIWLSSEYYIEVNSWLHVSHTLFRQYVYNLHENHINRTLLMTKNFLSWVLWLIRRALR